MTTILPYDTESSLHLIRAAVAASVYVRRDVTFEYEGQLYAVGTKLRNLQDRRKKLSDSVRQQLEEIEKLNAALKPKTIAQMRVESAKANKVVAIKASPRLIKQRTKTKEHLVKNGVVTKNARIGLNRCNAVCYHGNNFDKKYYCRQVLRVRTKCAKHAKKGKETMAVHDPDISTSQNAYIAPSGIIGANRGVRARVTFRKNDAITVYAAKAIVSPSVYKRDYVDKNLKDCDYSFRINKTQIAIGLTDPETGQGIGSFLNSSYKNPEYKNNTKFVVKGNLVYTVLKTEGLPAHKEFFAPYKRSL